MPRPIEQPTVTREPRAGGEETVKYEHPAYATIGAHRTSTHANLYGSDFTHHNTVRISIHKSRLTRGLSTDWVDSDLRPYIEVELSEAQWASFVSSMNVGMGTQCTLRELGGKSIPDLPSPESRREQFKGEAVNACREAFAALDELKAMLADAKLSQKARDDLAKQAERVRSRMNSSLPFVLDMFGEHMETAVEKAKTEINAYYVSTVQRAGLAALAGEAPPLQLKGA
jgi:hypothetical protein